MPLTDERYYLALNLLDSDSCFEESLSKAKDYIRAEGGAYLLVTDGNKFEEERLLHDEIFGPATLLVQCENTDELIELASKLDGRLTAQFRPSRKTKY